MAYLIYNMIANEPFLSVASSQIAAPQYLQYLFPLAKLSQEPSKRYKICFI